MTKDSPSDTKIKILTEAEKLFSKKGYDATSIESIAKQSKIPKSLIYYYFKSKNEILEQLIKDLLNKIMQEIQAVLIDYPKESMFSIEVFQKSFEILIKYKNIIKIILMESLKSTNNTPILLNIAKLFVSEEVSTLIKISKEKNIKMETDINQMAVTEFFTSVIPLLYFVVYKDEWAEYFKISKKEVKQKFINAYNATHAEYHRNLGIINGSIVNK